MKKPRKSLTPITIGWRELIDLPELGINHLRAKIDTGARTSALHAVDIEPYERDGDPWVHFHVPLTDSVHEAPRVLAPAHDRRAVKNTSGIPEDRWIIRPLLRLGERQWRIQISLANRENMGFDLILGRTAIRGRRVLVNPGRSYLAGPPQAKATKPSPVDDSIILLRKL